METTRRIGEIMIPIEKYPWVRDKATLREAVTRIEQAHLEVASRTSLPRVLLVFDELHVMVGYLRRRDIMRGLEPWHLVSRPLDYSKKQYDIEIDPNLAELSYGHLARGTRRQANRPVSDVMRPIETTLDVGDHLMKAVQEMVSLDVNLIPVLDKRHLVGVVRSVDIFNALAALLG